VIPSKIFENTAMGKPILLGVEGESKQLIESYNAGMCYEPENSKEFINACNEIYANKELYKSLQKGCLNLARDFERKKLASRMLTLLKQTI
jgi:glycosyltransferase involved in cell wall biosynthesis